MATNPTTYKGDDAEIYIYANSTDLTHSTLAISDFSLTIDRGTAEQNLVGETGNLFIAGARSTEGSLTSCKVNTAGIGGIVSDMIGGNSVQISGSCGTNSLHFYFKSAMITGFDFSIGTADDITEGSVDFTLLFPYKVSSVNVKSGQAGTQISDFGDWA